MHSLIDEAGMARTAQTSGSALARQDGGAQAGTTSATTSHMGKQHAIGQNHPIIWLHPEAPVLSVDAQPGTVANAVFAEVKTSVERLVDQGETRSVDLRFMQSMPAERAALESLLGRGEVLAEVHAAGRSKVQETAIPCVWLIRHFNSEDELVGELIEVTDVPEILVSDRQAVTHCLTQLNAKAPTGSN
ncbi:MAG TPA: hydrogenase expression/formation C-terminal domain-containing protein [Rhodoferax sp.]|nr:hydrogenase expression/formation C-terminal domain-containing protein [Rhodoferax sp.]